MTVLFLICAFRSGADRFYLKRAVGLKADGREVFYFFRFKNAFRLVSFYLCFYGLKLLVFAFSFAPLSALLIYTADRTYNRNFSAALFYVLIFTGAALFVFGLVFFIRLNSFFFLARYCFASENFYSLKRLFRFAFSCIVGKRRTVTVKKLSFIPWFLSCVFLLPISFVRSYYNQTMAQLAADLIEKHLQRP